MQKLQASNAQHQPTTTAQTWRQLNLNMNKG